jgi:hypothetical protein
MMAQAEEYYEEKIRGSVFREPEFSTLTSSYEGEAGREFLLYGQRTLHVLSSDPETGGSVYQRAEHRGRVGIIHSEGDADTYGYIELTDREEAVCIQEVLPDDEALTLLDDADACARFLTDHLVQMTLTFWDF